MNSGADVLNTWLGLIADVPRLLGLVAQCPAAWVAGGCGAVALAVRLFCRLAVDECP